MSLRAQLYTEDLDYKVLKKHSLNFFDVVKNSNKFYTLELHCCDGYYKIFTDYGRLGVSSTKQERTTDSLYVAESEYEKILKSKLKKGYKEVDLAQSNTGSTKAKEIIDITKVQVSKSKKKLTTKKTDLKKAIQEFVVQIYKEAELQLNHFAVGEFNSKNTSPLGKLTKTQIQKGRTILQDISNIINKKGNVTVQEVIDLSNEYYVNIPKAFGLKMSIEDVAIRSLREINEQLDILKFYEDSLRMEDVLYNDNIQEQYESLKCDINVLAKNSKLYKELVEYVKKSQSKHHNVDLHVKRIFTVKQKNSPKFDDSVGNKKLLFHGTRSANLPGILSTHIKLPTQLKGVYITGAMFGPGIYFADQSTKSSQYSCSRFGGRTNKYDTAFLLVSEVALGKIKEEKRTKYHYNAPRGYHSVKGVEGPELLHNEYIIYNENQHELKYIIEFEPKRKRRN